ncbi:MAG: EVE domain-containing protein [Candidatus Hadarchaeum sp.]|uniref:EVE domain-containing protein n=1 Tax=Candidatus Hadarchaeum sp. TaxID=2883567 RepID=UPI00317DFBFD
MQVWICVGKVENWETAISGNIWGVKERQKNLWEKLQKGDLLLFYATSPVSGIIGVAKIDNKVIQDKPLWPEEREKNKLFGSTALSLKLNTFFLGRTG